MGRTSRVRHFITTVTVNGESLGRFDMFTGGQTTSESVKHASSSFRGRRAALGGVPEVSDVTVGIHFDHTRHHALAARLEPLCGFGEMTVSRQPLDANASPFGQPRVYTGLLQAVNYPEHNVDSDDLAMFELVMTVDGDIG